MMNNIKIKRFCLLHILFLGLSVFLMSCTTEVTLAVQKDGSVNVNFEAGAGAAFAKMLAGAAGATDNNGAIAIDTEAVSYELAKAGFENVKVNAKKDGAVQITMSDRTLSSYIFKSGIIKNQKGMLSAAITRKSLEDFYKEADEQTRLMLDLLLAPVFNDENMSEAEYLEMLASFYGNRAADEVSQSIVKINLISKDGNRKTLRFPLSQLMCGNLPQE